MFRILFILPELPFPPESGSRQKVYNLLSYLGKNHKCDIISFQHASAALAECLPSEECQKLGPNVKLLESLTPNRGIALLLAQFKYLLLGKSPALGRCDTQQGREAIARALSRGNYDIVHVDMFMMASYVSSIPAEHSVLSVNDAVSLTLHRMSLGATTIAGRFKFRILSKLVSNTEKRLYRRFRAVHVVSELDQEYLEEKTLARNFATITLPARESWFNRVASGERTSNNAISIFCAGHFERPFSWQPLVEFIDTYWPTLSARYPEIRMDVVGKRPSVKLRQSCNVAGINLSEYVPDYEAVLMRADVVMYLDKSGPSGIKARVVEAMASGKPIIATDVMMENTGARPGEHFLLAQDPEGAFTHMSMLLNSEAERGRLGAAARECAEHSFSNRIIGDQWLLLYQEVARPLGSTSSNLYSGSSK
jgi:glycosyltransferase involved in cell wall biosynthesis